jgi:uncharacterized protein (TIGR00730 family)
MIHKIAVFCGSSLGVNPQYSGAAYSIGKYLAQNNIGLVYGGAQIGLMGSLARGVLEHEGEVIGVIPHFLAQKEIVHNGLTELIMVDSMHERKMKMHELSDAAIAIPGGFGTLDELFEMLTWSQLGMHKKAVAIWNVNNYFLPLKSFISKMVDDGFLKPHHRDLLLIDSNLESLMERIKSYKSTINKEWISEEQS